MSAEEVTKYVNHMAGWKQLGRTPEGLRRLAGRIMNQRGLESYVRYALEAAAELLEQCQVPAEPVELEMEERARRMVAALRSSGMEDQDVEWTAGGMYGRALIKELLSEKPQDTGAPRGESCGPEIREVDRARLCPERSRDYDFEGDREALLRYVVTHPLPGACAYIVYESSTGLWHVWQALLADLHNAGGVA